MSSNFSEDDSSSDFSDNNDSFYEEPLNNDVEDDL
jgi:hypothetical protein